jgi:NIPSNAP
VAGEIIELRRYTLRPGTRETLIDVFDGHLVEPQEALGMRVVGQFREVGEADAFVWLRAFEDMAARRKGLAAFYGGPDWAAHKGAANPTMVDFSDVLLLRPAFGSAFAELQPRPPAGAAPPGTGGVVEVTVIPVEGDAQAFARAFAKGALPRLVEEGAVPLSLLVTEPAPNDFPALPVREGETVFVSIVSFLDRDSADACAGAFSQALAAMPGSTSGPPIRRRLEPTARSRLRHLGRSPLS